MRASLGLFLVGTVTADLFGGANEPVAPGDNVQSVVGTGSVQNPGVDAAAVGAASADGAEVAADIAGGAGNVLNGDAAVAGGASSLALPVANGNSFAGLAAPAADPVPGADPAAAVGAPVASGELASVTIQDGAAQMVGAAGGTNEGAGTDHEAGIFDRLFGDSETEDKDTVMANETLPLDAEAAGGLGAFIQDFAKELGPNATEGGNDLLRVAPMGILESDLPVEPSAQSEAQSEYQSEAQGDAGQSEAQGDSDAIHSKIAESSDHTGSTIGTVAAAGGVVMAGAGAFGIWARKRSARRHTELSRFGSPSRSNNELPRRFLPV
ncbi:putative transmembrane protein [Gregarina niphandrodes]|uniref:Transmembrane protein n=1 Tax=Gregarina niphandrodes TaxID=110365 RepID=A0A023BBA8_GRENI|nr:putative transmembrane protein [Gregarina niphandrodes]EZG79455.1 putative transmembrane protein [Gregarina niphandrodes]|eukprot:XP_011134432.1 putative transmembrane protein [Gregarina niphandrodes]